MHPHARFLPLRGALARFLDPWTHVGGEHTRSWGAEGQQWWWSTAPELSIPTL